LRRHWLLVLVGLWLSLTLALLSQLHISTTGVSYRTSEVWSNEATLALSQASAPELQVDNEQTTQLAMQVDFYAAYATSDAVINGLRRRGFLTAEDIRAGATLPIAASVVPSPLNSAPTALLKVTASGLTPATATTLTKAATDELIAYVKRRQIAANIPERKRVQLRIVQRASEPKLIVPRSKSKAILILLAGLTATFAAAFVRDNIQRRPPPGQSGEVTALHIPDAPRRQPDVFAFPESESQVTPPVRRSPEPGDHGHGSEFEALPR
jgi:hypothetical protein